MATAKAPEPKPLIQIDDLVREMTDEEYEIHLELIAEIPELTVSE
jgi:hypothetical protein